MPEPRWQRLKTVLCHFVSGGWISVWGWCQLSKPSRAACISVYLLIQLLLFAILKPWSFRTEGAVLWWLVTYCVEHPKMSKGEMRAVITGSIETLDHPRTAHKKQSFMNAAPTFSLFHPICNNSLKKTSFLFAVFPEWLWGDHLSYCQYNKRKLFCPRKPGSDSPCTELVFPPGKKIASTGALLFACDVCLNNARSSASDVT